MAHPEPSSRLVTPQVRDLLSAMVQQKRARGIAPVGWAASRVGAPLGQAVLWPGQHGNSGSAGLHDFVRPAGRYTFTICSRFAATPEVDFTRLVPQMKIKDFLAEQPAQFIHRVSPDATLAETAQAMLKFKVGALIVADGQRKLQGIVSERDLIHVVAENVAGAAERAVESVMTNDVITCTPEDEVGFVLRLMNTNAIRHLPVLENDRLIHMMSIRELTKAYEILQIEANTDPLTELSNRRPFLKTMKSEFARAKRTGRPMSVAMIDLDHFKNVNDTYGHDAGDEVLRRISDLLILEFRSIDLIGRLGGEEFAVVFPETDLDGAHTACDRLRRVIAKTPIETSDQTIFVTASIGIATIDAETESDAALLKLADEQLYAAKTAGRNMVLSIAA